MYWIGLVVCLGLQTGHRQTHSFLRSSECRCMMRSALLNHLYCFVELPVPTFSEERCQQTADYAAEEETLQEPNHPWLQDFGCRSHQYGWGRLSSFSLFLFQFLCSPLFLLRIESSSTLTVIDMVVDFFVLFSSCGRFTLFSHTRLVCEIRGHLWLASDTQHS